MPRLFTLALVLAGTTGIVGCGDNEPANGELVIATSFAPACPSITWAVAAPMQTSVGGSIGVAATASDPDPGDVLGYRWSPAEAFVDPTAASTSYNCNSAGPKTLSLAVSDHHRPSPCVATATLQVTCIASKKPSPGL